MTSNRAANILSLLLNYLVIFSETYTQKFQTFTKINLNGLPIIKIPVVFTFLSALTFINGFIFSNFLFTFISIIYPFVHGVNIILTEPTNNMDDRLNEIFRVYKYLSILTLMMALESFFSIVTYFIPGYNYIKMVAVYLLIRNNFALSSQIYNAMLIKIEALNISQKIGLIFNNILGKIAENSFGQTVLSNFIANISGTIEIDKVAESTELKKNN